MYKLNSKNSFLISVSLIALAAILHFQLFTYVFHQTTDDNLYQFIALSQNLKSMLSFATWVAQQQGRIGHYPFIFLSYLSNYFIDIQLFRIFVVLIFAAFYAMCFAYLDLLLGTKIFMVACSLAIASVPLAKFHFPPNSYPLQFTLSLLTILVLRYFVYRLQWEDRKQRFWIIVARLGLLFPLMVLEYSFIFGFLLAAIEAWVRIEFGAVFSEYKISKIFRNISKKIYKAITTPQIFLDILVLGLVLASYLIFRLIFPSFYEGNTLGSFDWKDILYVQLQHSIGGFSIAHWNLQQVFNSNLFAWTKAIGVGLCLSCVIWLNWVRARLPVPRVLIFLGLAWAFFF